MYWIWFLKTSWFIMGRRIVREWWALSKIKEEKLRKVSRLGETILKPGLESKAAGSAKQ
jgi:ATP-dependent RNA circularization protein (DNA/RNA ligase family)